MSDELNLDDSRITEGADIGLSFLILCNMSNLFSKSLCLQLISAKSAFYREASSILNPSKLQVDT